MIEPARVPRILHSYTYTTPSVCVPLLQALGKVLRSSVTAAADSPPFHKAAMDGFALRTEDLKPSSGIVEFQVLGCVGAGEVPAYVVGRGRCVQIMTGAMMPEGADKVVRVEYTELKGGFMRLSRPEPNINVIYAGENLRAGEPVLRAPCRLRPQDIAILASHGVASVEVAQPVRVGVISTGSELLAPGEPAQAGKIYDSNSYQIAAYCLEMGLPYTLYGTVADSPNELRAVFERAMNENDMVISSGGVSMGEFDYVPTVLRELGAEVLFHTIAYKPGKSTLFARRGSTCIFGLAGNPAASVVLFRVLIEPTLLRMMGLESQVTTFHGTLSETIRRSTSKRREYLPAHYAGGRIYPLEYGGSSHLDAFSTANCVVELDVGTEELKMGEELDARPL